MGKIGSAGGIASALKSRKEALDRYYSNPNICLHCHSIIEVKDGLRVRDARVKKFCSRSCAASYNNKNTKKKDPNRCPICGVIIRKQSQTCNRHRKVENPMFNRTKGEFKKDGINYTQWRNYITKMARRVFYNNKMSRCCAICGYDKTFDICHIKAVSDFDDDAIMGEINAPENLIALCPNHHWEFDHGLIDKNKIAHYGSGLSA